MKEILKRSLIFAQTWRSPIVVWWSHSVGRSRSTSEDGGIFAPLNLPVFGRIFNVRFKWIRNIWVVCLFWGTSLLVGMLEYIFFYVQLITTSILWHCKCCLRKENVYQNDYICWGNIIKSRLKKYCKSIH